MAAKKPTHVNCKGDYPVGPGQVIRRGEPYAPSAAELKSDPRRWAKIGTRRAVRAIPVPGPATATARPPKGG